MAFGFPAYSVSSQRYNLGQADLRTVVGESLHRLGWHYEVPEPYKFVARNAANLWSWGEKISVEVSYDGVVTARSECLLVTQCFDWGKNHRNVKAFFAEVSRGAFEREPPQSQFASHDGESPVERVFKDAREE